MLVWGSGSGYAPIGAAGAGHCANCNAVRAFNYGVNYRYAHVWYVFKWITRRAYVRLCSICDKGTDVTKAEALAGGQLPKLPGLPRWAWGIVAALIAGVAITAYLGIAQDKQQIAEAVAHPKAGDVFLLDLSEVSSDYSGHHDYGLMKVVAVAADGAVSVLTANDAFGRLADARKELRRSDYATATRFDDDDPIALSAARLAELRDSGAIDAVRR